MPAGMRILLLLLLVARRGLLGEGRRRNPAQSEGADAPQQQSSFRRHGSLERQDRSFLQVPLAVG